jgi:hypothetical protein
MYWPLDHYCYRAAHERAHSRSHVHQSRSTTWFRKYKWQKGSVPTSWSCWRVQGGRRRSWPGLYDTWLSPAWFPLKEGIRSNLAPKWSRSQPPLVSCPAATRSSCGRRCWWTSCLLPLAIAINRHTASSSMYPVQHDTTIPPGWQLLLWTFLTLIATAATRYWCRLAPWPCTTAPSLSWSSQRAHGGTPSTANWPPLDLVFLVVLPFDHPTSMLSVGSTSF